MPPSNMRYVPPRIPVAPRPDAHLRGDAPTPSRGQAEHDLLHTRVRQPLDPAAPGGFLGGGQVGPVNPRPPRRKRAS